MARDASTDLIGDDRPMRVCDLCGAVDDHPRHVIAGAVRDAMGPPDQAVVAKVLDLDLPSDLKAKVLADLHDTSSQDRHLDCCREAGCPDGSCAVVTAGAEDKRGADLLKHIMKGA